MSVVPSNVPFTNALTVEPLLVNAICVHVFVDIVPPKVTVPLPYKFPFNVPFSINVVYLSAASLPNVNNENVPVTLVG